MDPIKIIEKYYPVDSEAYRILVDHSRSVADKALAIARMHPEMDLDLTFIEEAAMLHDIGIFRCNAPSIDCHGEADYICHGFLGAELMRAEGYPQHALVCERHTGTGLSIEMIELMKWPLSLWKSSLSALRISFSAKQSWARRSRLTRLGSASLAMAATLQHASQRGVNSF